MKFFDDFADTGPGSWLINVLSVVAGLILLKVVVSRFPDSGPLGAIKAGINFA